MSASVSIHDCARFKLSGSEHNTTRWLTLTVTSKQLDVDSGDYVTVETAFTLFLDPAVATDYPARLVEAVQWANNPTKTEGGDVVPLFS